MSTKLIVALDFDNQKDVFKLIDQIDPAKCALKVGNELFTHFGTDLVKQLIKQQFNVFLDLKYHDIPNTVSRACKAGAELGVWMLNVHASGGSKMMEAAVKAIEPFGRDKPLLIAVTVLTSFTEQELLKVGVTTPIDIHVNNLAMLAMESGLDGVVCSAHEAQAIKQNCGRRFIAVTPGIRLADNSSDDQSRIMTPDQASKAGSDYLVIGRPITQSINPAKIIDEILLIM